MTPTIQSSDVSPNPLDSVPAAGAMEVDSAVEDISMEDALAALEKEISGLMVKIAMAGGKPRSVVDSWKSLLMEKKSDSQELTEMATLMSSGGLSGGVFPAAGPQAVLSNEVNLANFVPPDLPLFQWPGSMLDKKREPFPNIEGCICRFEDILNSHRMVLDVHWLRLLPRCLGHDLRDWLNEFVKAAGTGVPWTTLKVAIIARYGTPKEQLRFGRIREFLACTKSDEEPIDSFLERFKSLKSKSGVNDKHVVATVFFGAFPEAVARLIMISMGQADESCFYDLEFVSAVARRVDLVGYDASSVGSARKRPSDIPVSAEAKKYKYVAMPSSSPSAVYEKKSPWVSKFGKTMKEHVAKHTCKDCNGYFGKGHNCNVAIRTPSSSRGGSNKVLRTMTKKSSRHSVDAMVSTAFACEEADRVLQARKSASKSGRANELAVKNVAFVPVTCDDSLESVTRVVGSAASDIEMSEMGECSTDDEFDLQEKAHQLTLVETMSNVSVVDDELIVNMSAQQCKFDAVFSAPPTLRSNSICVPLVVQSVVCFDLVDTGATFSCITNEFFDYLGGTKHPRFNVVDDGSCLQLAHEVSSVPRVGSVELNVEYSKVNKSHLFEVFSFYSEENAHVLLGMDVLSKLGIGISGLVSPHGF